MEALGTTPLFYCFKRQYNLQVMDLKNKTLYFYRWKMKRHPNSNYWDRSLAMSDQLHARDLRVELNTNELHLFMHYSSSPKTTSPLPLTVRKYICVSNNHHLPFQGSHGALLIWLTSNSDEWFVYIDHFSQQSCPLSFPSRNP